MGVQTVMYMATYFAGDELHMETTQLLAVVLIIQLVAIGGARLFAYISQQFGNIIALTLLVIIWIGICISAYSIETVNAFYALAVTVGMVMGGIQSLSRSTYAKLLPPTHDTASFFSFYDVCEKIGIVIGTSTFGYIANSLGGMRNATLALGGYFLIGLMLLLPLLKKNKLRPEH
jgi:UMF1 family MFS transporter